MTRSSSPAHDRAREFPGMIGCFRAAPNSGPTSKSLPGPQFSFGLDLLKVASCTRQLKTSSIGKNFAPLTTIKQRLEFSIYSLKDKKYIFMLSREYRPGGEISIFTAVIRSRPKLNCGPGKDFEVGPEFGAARKQPIIPGNSRARSCAGEEDRVTWLDLRPG